MWSNSIRKVTEKIGVTTSFWSISGVRPFLKSPLNRHQSVVYISDDEKYQYDEARLEFIKKWKPEIVIVCTPWSIVKESDTVDLFNFLQEHTNHILLIEQPPELTIGDRNVLQHLCYQRVQPEDGVVKCLPMGLREAGEKGRQLTSTLVSKYRNCSVIRTFDLYNSGGEVIVLDGRSVLYLDDNHLTSEGADRAINRIEQSLSEALPH